jgi:hypothetical protein
MIDNLVCADFLILGAMVFALFAYSYRGLISGHAYLIRGRRLSSLTARLVGAACLILAIVTLRILIELLDRYGFIRD